MQKLELCPESTAALLKKLDARFHILLGYLSKSISSLFAAFAPGPIVPVVRNPVKFLFIIL